MINHSTMTRYGVQQLSRCSVLLLLHLLHKSLQLLYHSLFAVYHSLFAVYPQPACCLPARAIACSPPPSKTTSCVGDVRQSRASYCAQAGGGRQTSSMKAWPQRTERKYRELFCKVLQGRLFCRCLHNYDQEFSFIFFQGPPRK